MGLPNRSVKGKDMRLPNPVVVLFFGLALLFASVGKAQAQASSEGTRRVVRKVVPSYPELAKKMNLTGTVRVLATVSPDGTVRSLQAMGGSPVLIKATEDSVYKWKFATAATETKEVVELHFTPEQ
jgi:TonB family protein